MCKAPGASEGATHCTIEIISYKKTGFHLLSFLQLLNTLKEKLVLLPKSDGPPNTYCKSSYELSMSKLCLARGRAGWHLTKLKQMLKQQMMNKLKAADKQKSKAYVQFY